MKLYGYLPSPNTRKLLAVAAYLELPLQFETLDLVRGDQHKLKFLTLNPNAKAPILKDGDFVLWESNAIMHYLATSKPNTLWPHTHRDQSDVLRWLLWEQTEWVKGWKGLLWEKMRKKLENLGGPDSAAVDRSMAAFRRCASILERVLSTQPCVARYGLSIADLALAAPLDYAAELDIPLDDFGNVKAWYDRIAALAAWHDSRPEF